MKIKCRECGHTEEVNTKLFVEIIGGALPIGGFWAWVTYFLAGTVMIIAVVVFTIVRRKRRGF